MFRRQISLQFLFILLSYLVAGLAYASMADDKVQALLGQKQAPPGVVFEIVSGDADALQWAIPRVQQFINTLRKKFPALEVAVVSHGLEQFSLQEANADEYSKVHESVKALSMQQDVPVHICQTFAGWNGVEPEAFPEYVTVSAAGPAQINDYIDLGYTLIKINRK